MNTKNLSFILNDVEINIKVNPSLPLLDYIRKEKHLTGTKEVCKEGDCGACAVLFGEVIDNKLNYKTITSCIYPIGNCNGKHIVTIEGINKQELLLHQKAFVDENASQCGFCTPGFIISFTCYLLNNEKYNLDDAINSIAGNICRCTGYHSIERAMDTVIKELQTKNELDKIDYLIQQNIIPEYFKEIKKRLINLSLPQETIPDKSAIFIGGGSDLFVQKPDDLLEEEVYLITERKLNYIRESNSIIKIGSGTTFEEIKQSEILNKFFPSLKNDVDLIASLPVRNVATVGGNLSNASPIGDITIILLSLNANLTLSDGEQERNLPLKEFYLDYKKLNKQKIEFIKEVSFHIPPKKFYFNFEKVSKRTYLDIASVNSAILIEVDNDKIISASISAGGVAPIPKLLVQTNNYLKGKKISIDIIDEALQITQSEISPISDVRGSAEYKRLLLNQLIKSHFLKLFPQKIFENELV
ncbi:MAG TPA: (2Fe-2S)-binding protein [Ignavibacteria bacterium]|nr:(2Fe-2S)-binding protein [Ignavibacteria bacterium]